MNQSPMIREIQQKYDRLKESILFYPDASKNRITLIGDWIEFLLDQPSPNLTRSFLAESLSQLTQHIPGITAEGCPPELFRKLGMLVRNAFTECESLFQESEITSLIQRLEVCHITSWCHLGTPEMLDTHEMRASFHDHTPVGVDERSTLAHYITFRKQHGLPVSPWDEIARAWDLQVIPHDGIAHVPLLEQDPSHGEIHGFVQYGRISTLQLVLGERLEEAGDDKFVISNLVADSYRQLLDKDLARVAAATKTLAARLFGDSRSRPRTIMLSFTESAAHHEGASYNLGLAVAYLCMQSAARGRQERHLISSGTTITGAISESGMAVEVGSDAIRAKVRAVFFSPFTRLVIPKSDERAAIDELTELHSVYPLRKLRLLPVTELADIFNSRELIETKRLPISKRISNTIVRHSKPFAFTMILTTSLIFAYSLLASLDYDANPFEGEVSGSNYTIKNRNGKTLWRVVFKGDPVPVAQGFGPVIYRNLVDIADIDSDENSEVVLGFGWTRPGQSDSIYCYHSNGERYWSQPVGRPTITTENDYTSSAFHITAVEIAEVDPEPGLEVLCTAVNDFYSCFFYIFNSKGKLLKQYYHCGSLFSILVTHNPITMEPEILLGGTHNGFNKPILVVLDPEFVTGKSPMASTRQLIDPVLSPGLEKYYLRIPLTSVTASLNNFPFYWTLANGSQENGYRIEVFGGVLPEQDESTSVAGIFTIILLDDQFRPTRFHSSSSFDRAYEYLKKHGRVTEVIDEAYKQRYLSEMEYWDGDKFVTMPTMNRRYVEAKAVAAKSDSRK